MLHFLTSNIREPTHHMRPPGRMLCTRDTTVRFIIHKSELLVTNNRIERMTVRKRNTIGCINGACSQIIRAINMTCGSVRITSFRVQMTKGLSLIITVTIVGSEILTAVAYNAVQSAESQPTLRRNISPTSSGSRKIPE
jgi:hypothetical protein